MPEWINYANKRVSRSPARIIWWVIGTILSITLVLVIAIGGAYAIALHTADDEVQNAKHQAAVQQQDARREGVQVCKAMVTLDESGHGVKFNKPGPSEIVLGRMLRGIHEVVVTSGCEKETHG
jgi:hypothetical protein